VQVCCQLVPDGNGSFQFFFKLLQARGIVHRFFQLSSEIFLQYQQIFHRPNVVFTLQGIDGVQPSGNFFHTDGIDPDLLQRTGTFSGKVFQFYPGLFHPVRDIRKTGIFLRYLSRNPNCFL